MDEWLKGAKDFIKNPLGIIGLFISLIYGAMCLVLNSIILELCLGLQIALVGFLITFPFVVLLVFMKLVSNHPNRLYSPSDFRSDEEFNKYFNIKSLSVEEDKRKTEAEFSEFVKEIVNEKQTEVDNNPTSIQEQENKNDIGEESNKADEGDAIFEKKDENNINDSKDIPEASENLSDKKKLKFNINEENFKSLINEQSKINEYLKNNVINGTYEFNNSLIQNHILTEELAIRKFEKDYSVIVKRRVRMTALNGENIELDGFAKGKKKKYLIEVKEISTNSVSNTMLRNIKNQISWIVDLTLSKVPEKNVKIVFIIVHKKGLGKVIEKQLFNLFGYKGEFFHFELYCKENLLKEYNY